MKNLEDYYLKHPEPIQGCLLALKHIIMGIDKEITHTRIFQIPFFLYKNWRFAFLYVHNKKIMFSTVIDHRLQPQAKGNRRKDSMSNTLLLDPKEDLPIDAISESLKEHIKFYNNIKDEAAKLSI